MITMMMTKNNNEYDGVAYVDGMTDDDDDDDDDTRRR